MHVVATAGHVDHGKSTLVRALTGMEPDRWAEERRRGMTIDLGYAWTTLPGGAEIAFVDVPGHQRFIANMLAGLGPAPAVLFVVAADEGWSRQSDEHLAAAVALGVRHGVLAVTRSDLADPAATLADARERLGAAGLGDGGEVDAVAVSAVSGQGVEALRTALADLVTALPAPDADARLRLWIDRAFTVRGSGTVVTGTLAAGTLTVGDTLALGGREVTVRALQTLGRTVERVEAVARVAVNLRGVPRDSVHRGDALLTPDGWRTTSLVDVRLGVAADSVPGELVLHVGTTAVPVRVRPLAGDTARLTLHTALPLQAGDRAVLRDPGRQAVATGALVLDADPPVLRRRGAAVRRAGELEGAAGAADAHVELERRGAATRTQLRRLGADPQAAGAHREIGEVLVAEWQWRAWTAALRPALEAWAADHPLDPAMPPAALARTLALPDPQLLTALLQESGRRLVDGRVGTRAHADLGPAEPALRALEARLRAAPLAAPDRDELAAWKLGRRELAAAERAGRILRLADDVVVAPDAVTHAVAALRALPSPFSASEAKQALGITRRVAIPLLEHLDAAGHTERVDGTTRRLR